VTTQKWSCEVPETFIHATLDPEDIGFGYDTTVGIVADAADLLGELADRLEARGVEPSGTGRRRVRAVAAAEAERRESFAVADEPPFTSMPVLRRLRETLDRDTIVTADSGGFRLWAAVMFEAYHPRRYVHSGSWASMGLSLPAAIGAQVAHPDEDVVATTGDGGLMMCVHELHTLANEGLPVTVVVANNNNYAVISQQAAADYQLDESQYAWEDHPVKFHELAESVGVNGAYATSLDEFQAVTEDAVASDEPWLVEVPTDPEEPQAYELMYE
jgi:acetolactate synthase-1/2/3 large subunit